MTNVGCAVGSEYARRRREHYEEWHQRHQAHYLWQDEVVGRVYAHYLKGIDLLRHAHRAKLGGNVRPHLTGKNKTHNARRELQQQYLASGVTRHPTRHPWTLDVELHLNTYHGSDDRQQSVADGYWFSVFAFFHFGSPLA